MKYLITYEDALELVKTYDNFNFSKTEYMISGYKLVTFSYFLCEFNHFEHPLKDKSEVKAHDMRGLTFIFNKDGSLYKRFFMLSKFFNLNQVETTQYDVVKDKKIKSISEKEDGSLVAFMNLPDGTIFAKTIKSFNNDQTVAAMKLLNNSKRIKDFIKNCLAKDLTPIFEYVSYDNRIVLKYSTPELRLIGVRSNITGEYIPVVRLLESLYEIRTTKEVKDLSLDELIEKSKTEEDKEGWVVEFEDGQLIKIKTEWYFHLHNIRTMSIFREDYVIKNYIEETIDDIIVQLDPVDDADAFKFVDRVKLAVENYIKYIDENVRMYVDKYYDEYAENWTKFATENHKTAFFSLIKTKIDKPESYNERKISFIGNQTKHLNESKFFVDKWNGNTEEFITKWNK